MFSLVNATQVLEATPGTLQSLLSGLDGSWTAGAEDRTDWSPREIVGHLIHAENTDWIPRARVILEQGETGRFEPFDRFAHFELFRESTLAELLDTFAMERRSSLKALASFQLTKEDLDRFCTHPELGRVSLQQLLSTWVVHDLTHIRQIITWMAKRYQHEVGPWKAYLSILK